MEAANISATTLWIIGILVALLSALIGYFIASSRWKGKYEQLQFYYDEAVKEKKTLNHKNEQLSSVNKDLTLEVSQMEDLLADANQQAALLEVELEKTKTELIAKTSPKQIAKNIANKAKKQQGSFRKAIGSVFSRFGKKSETPPLEDPNIETPE